MGECSICRHRSNRISPALGLCRDCILRNRPEARARAAAAHARSRDRSRLPARPPRSRKGVRCSRCGNACRIAPGRIGYCGIRRNDDGRLRGGDARSGAVGWYHDPLPTNCVADWVCPASGRSGYPAFTDTEGPEYGQTNLAVFYESCTFDCLFCQNWQFRGRRLSGSRRSAAELAAAAGPATRCICFFGGDPTSQIPHALAAVRAARATGHGRILRVCWETNGSASRYLLKKMAEVSLESGGCIKFDLKAWDDPLHRALCGVTNRRTLQNFHYLSRWIARRPDPPLLVASTLLVPGYVEEDQVGPIAEFIARLDREIPYALLAFHPAFEMSDLPATTARQAKGCLAAALAAGLTRVRIGNMHLLT